MRLHSSGYLIKDKLSYSGSFRFGYPEFLINVVNKGDFTSYFADGIMKFKYIHNKNNFFTFSYFSSLDQYNNLNLFTSYDYIVLRNNLYSLKWHKTFNKKMIANTTLGYSKWTNGDLKEITALNRTSFGIQNIIGKSEFSYFYNPTVTLKFGANFTQFNNLKSIHFPINTFDKNPYINQGTELATYLSAEKKLPKNWNISLGIRPTLYLAQLPFDYKNYSLSPRFKLSKASKENNLHYFFHLEQMMQFQHNISKDLTLNVFDFWTSSNTILPPQIANSVSTGFNLTKNKWSFNLETYYKQFKNTFDYIDGANPNKNNFYTELSQNSLAYSYGIESSISFKTKKFDIMVNGVYARSLRRSIFINNNALFPASMDRPIFISALGKRQLSKKWEFNAAFLLQSGRPATIYYNSYFASKRNEIRFPIYHRLDVGFTYTKRPEKEKWQSSWTFSAYNVYNHRNVYAVTYDQITRQARTFTLYPVLPTLSYNLKIR